MKNYLININGKDIKASPYQCKIFDFVEHGVGNMIIKASAGSAKTTTIVNCMNYIDQDLHVLFIAFNNAIVKAIKDKVNRKNASIVTFHGLGYNILLKYFQENNIETEIDEDKYKNYVYSNLLELTEYHTFDGIKNQFVVYRKNIMQLVNMCREYNASTINEFSHIADIYGIIPIRDEFDVVYKVLKWGREHLETIDYTDMIWIPIVNNISSKSARYDWVFIDEAQDTSIIKQKLVEKCINPRGGRFIAVGDDAQQINIWAGASSEAMEKLEKKSFTQVTTLPISYRCPKLIVEMIKTHTDNIQADENAIDGEVNIDVNAMDAKDGDMVLCRNNAPLVLQQLRYFEINKNAYIKGGEELQNQLFELIKAMNCDGTVDRYLESDSGLFPKLYSHLLHSLHAIASKEQNTLEEALCNNIISTIYDHILVLKVLSNGCLFVDELIEKIKTILGYSNGTGVILSTVHKAKGLESDNVFILCPSLMPSKLAKKDWEIKTEHNLIYVAMTRAKKTLNYIKEDYKDKRIARFNKHSLYEDVIYASRKLHIDLTITPSTGGTVNIIDDYIKKKEKEPVRKIVNTKVGGNKFRNLQF